MVEYVPKVWALIIYGLRMDSSKRGAAAMLCCACRALALDAEGRSWTASQIMDEYAQMEGTTRKAVRARISKAMGIHGMSACSGLHWVVEEYRADPDIRDQLVDALVQIGELMPGIVTDYGYCCDREEWIRRIPLSDRMQCEYSQNGLCEYCIYWLRYKNAKGWGNRR